MSVMRIIAAILFTAAAAIGMGWVNVLNYEVFLALGLLFWCLSGSPVVDRWKVGS